MPAVERSLRAGLPREAGGGDGGELTMLAVALIDKRFFAHLFNCFNQRKYGKAEQDGYENKIRHLFALLLSWKAPIIGKEREQGNRMIPQALPPLPYAGLLGAPCCHLANRPGVAGPAVAACKRCCVPAGANRFGVALKSQAVATRRRCCVPGGAGQRRTACRRSRPPARRRIFCGVGL